MGWRARHAAVRAATMTRCWSASAGKGMVGGRAVVAARVVIFDRSGSGAVIGVGGRAAGRAELAQCENTADPAGVGGVRMAGLSRWGAMSRWHAVVGQGTRFERSGLVRIEFAGRHFDMRRFAVGGPAGRGGCHTVVTSDAKHGGTQGDALRRFLQVGGRGETGWDG
jgi:hypothetical protein